MAQYDIHSVRIEEEIWKKVKASGISVNQLLRKALELPWEPTRKVAGDSTHLRNTVLPSAVHPITHEEATRPLVERQPLTANYEVPPALQRSAASDLVSDLDAVSPDPSSTTGKVSTEHWREGRQPIPRPGEKK